MDPAGSRRALSEHLERWAADRSKSEVYEQAQAMHIPASYVAAPEDLVDSPQYRSRGFIHEAEHPDAGTFSTPGLPFSWEGAEAPIAPPPRLGQHNAEVFGELLDIDAAQLRRWPRRG